MNTNINDVEYYIELDTRTGVTVPVEARATILAAAGFDPTLSRFDNWTQELLEPAHDSYSIENGADGSTTLRSFRSPGVTASQLAMLETFIQHGGPGQNAVLYSQPGGGGVRTSLFECTGAGTATRHEATVVFPTYAGSTPVPGAADADNALMEMHAALLARRTATPADAAPRRTSRAEPHGDSMLTADSPSQSL